MTCDALTNSKRLCGVAEIPEGGAHEVVAQVEGVAESLLLLRGDNEVRAFFNVCPHAGRRLDWSPGRFLFDQGRLVCAAHGAAFTVPAGECVAGPCRGQRLTEVPVVQQGNEVFLA